jgi:hypothetical protein
LSAASFSNSPILELPLRSTEASASRGSFLFWLASDDLAEPDAIATLLPELLQDDEIGLACGDAEFIDAQGNPTTQ